MKSQAYSRALLSLALAPLLVTACGGAPQTALDGRSELPDEEDGLIVAIAGTGTGPQFLVVDPDGGDLETWQLDDDRGIQEQGQACLEGRPRLSWWEAEEAFFYNGQLGCQDGPWLIDDRGRVKRYSDLPDDLDPEDLVGALPAPAGGRLAFVQIYEDEDDEEHQDVAVIAENGEDWEQWSELPPGEILAMEWSPAGDALALLHWDSDEEQLSIRQVDQDGQETLLLGEDQDADLDLDEGRIRPFLRWSPDGSRLAFVHEDEPDSLMLLDLASSEVEERDLATDPDDLPAENSSPDESGIQAMAWSPDGEEVLLATGGRCFKRVTREGRVEECTDLLYTASLDDEDEEPKALTEVQQLGSLDLVWPR